VSEIVSTLFQIQKGVEREEMVQEGIVWTDDITFNDSQPVIVRSDNYVLI